MISETRTAPANAPAVPTLRAETRTQTLARIERLMARIEEGDSDANTLTVLAFRLSAALRVVDYPALAKPLVELRRAQRRRHSAARAAQSAPESRMYTGDWQ